MRSTGVQKTTYAKPSTHKARWFIVDASGQTLGRLATQLATVLMGKNRPGYTPYLDTGDFIVVTNASKVTVTGKKREQKIYQRYTGYMGGLREENFERMIAHHPEDVIKLAVRRMIPKGILGRAMLKKLKVFAGAEHDHVAQQPAPLTLKS